MRWHTLFQDLELELDGLHRQQNEAETREQIRTQAAEISLADRLRGNVGSDLAVVTIGGHRIVGSLSTCYPQWCLIARAGSEALVPLRAIVAITGLKQRTAPPARPTAQRLTFGHALRGLARDRAQVAIETRGGQFQGVFNQIGQDWAQLRLLNQPGDQARGTEVTLAHEAMCVVLNRA